MLFLCGLMLPFGSLAGDPATNALNERAAFLREEIRLAKSKQLYLVLDPVAETITLRRQHVDLLTVPVQARAGVSRLTAFHQPTWPAHSFTLDSDLPVLERPRVDPPEPTVGDSTAVAPVTVEALQAVRDRFLDDLPTRYKLSFAPDLDVIVVGESQVPTAADRWNRMGRNMADSWHSLGDLLSGHRSHRMRLQLVVTPQNARRLFLALEPDLSLLVVVATANPVAVAPQ